MAEMDEDDLDLVESEDENSDDILNQEDANQYIENNNFHPFPPLSRNVGTSHGAIALDQSKLFEAIGSMWDQTANRSSLPVQLFFMCL